MNSSEDYAEKIIEIDWENLTEGQVKKSEHLMKKWIGASSESSACKNVQDFSSGVINQRVLTDYLLMMDKKEDRFRDEMRELEGDFE